MEEEGGEAGPSVIEASCQIYDEAVAALPSAEMYERYASFLLQYVPRLQDTAGLDKLGRKALSVCSDAASAGELIVSGCLSPTYASLIPLWLPHAPLLVEPYSYGTSLSENWGREIMRRCLVVFTVEQSMAPSYSSRPLLVSDKSPGYGEVHIPIIILV